VLKQICNLRISKNNTSLSNIFNCEFGLAIFASNTTNGSRKMVALQRLYCTIIEIVSYNRYSFLLRIVQYASKYKAAYHQ
jgi:hypothetical protein